MPAPITTGNEKLIGADKVSENNYKERMQELDNFIQEMQSYGQQYYQSAKNSYLGLNDSPVQDTSQVYRYDENDPMASWGSSKYDIMEMTNLTSGQLNDTRYENQSSIDVLANGVGKMLGTAATTFVSSLVGLPYGAVQAASQGRWSALWDNDVTQALAGVDEWLDNNLTNYKNQKQQNSPWYDPSNLFSMNFIADDIIKNAGFTLGAATSMAVGAGTAGLMGRAMGLVNNVSKGSKVANNVLSALFSATGEGMIEARQGVEERNKLETQKLDDALAPEYNALELEAVQAQQEYERDKNQSLRVDKETGRAIDPAYERYKQKLEDIQAKKNILDQRKEAGVQQIQESGLEMGNKILLGNQVLLTAGNLIQFSKLMNKSFDNARHAAENINKAARPTLVTAARVGKDIAEGYALKGKNLGKILAGTKGLLTEGSEEMNQQFIQSASSAAYSEENVNDYWKAKLDPEAYRETTKGLYTLGNIIDRGFQESWGDVDQWEQFVIGGLTGMAGSYAPTKLFNQDQTKSRLDPRRYGSWEGGAYNEIRDFNEKYNQFEENVNDLNALLAKGDFPERVRDMVGHTYNETTKGAAAEADDKKVWKDADDKQYIMDVQAFLRAGKLSDLRAIYDNAAKEISEEDIQSVIKRTTKTITGEDGKEYFDGAYVDTDGNQIKTDDQIREDLKHNAEELNRKLNSYLESIDYVRNRTNGLLSKDQEDNLAYLHNMGKESHIRMQKTMLDVRDKLPQKFLLRTDKTPEELTQEYASSDLTFIQNDNTEKGYVEVDASLMNNAAFADFFQRNIMRGGNIQVEFGETAEEKAAREEEEKNLSSEERSKKAKERADNKWKEVAADKQRSVNLLNIAKGFETTYKKNHPSASQQEVGDAFADMWQNILDATELYTQAGEYYATLDMYMRNPALIDRDRAKETEKAAKEETKQKAKDKFAGKTAKELNQEIAAGTIDAAAVDDFADMSADAISDIDLQTAQQEAKKSKEIRQKAASLNNHIMESLGDNPTPEELSDANMAMQMVNNAANAANSPEEVSLDMIDTSSLPMDALDPNITADSIDMHLADVQEKIAGAFNALQEDENAQSDIPDQASVEGVSLSDAPQTGDDPVTKVTAEVAAPTVKPAQKNLVAPVNSLSEGALDNVIEETYKVTESVPDSAFRIATRRFGRTKTANGWRTTDKPYHDLVNDKDSLLYKRSKAIWEYLNKENAFERTENSADDRIENGDALHFMVKYIPEVFDSSFDEVSDDNKPYTLTILMLDDNNEVLGDLPLAQFEPSYRSGNPSQQVKDLIAFQEKAFNAFMDNYKKEGETEYRLDDSFSSTVKQVMRGDVPYSMTEKNSLNDVIGEGNLQLGVRLYNGRLATKKGEERTVSKNIVVPAVGNAGQPYMLLPMPTGEKIAVPFYTVPFTMEQHRDSEFHKMLRGSVFYLLKSDAFVSDKAKQNEYFSKHLNALKGLLQVDSKEGKRVLERKNGNIILNLRSLTDPDVDYTVSVSDTGNMKENARALVAQMDGIPINVSLDYLNGNIEIGITKEEKYSKEYNKLIGEIADVNLPKSTTHTVNGWFTADIPSEAVASNTPTEQKQPVSKEQTPVENIQNVQENIIEDIDKEAKDAGILSRKTADAWAAIPNDLKVKMVKEGAFITLSYGSKKVTTSWGDMRLRDILEAVNQSAKAGKLTASEAVKHMENNEAVTTREDERAARQWLAKNLPSLSSEERTQFVDKLSRVSAEDQAKVWGTYRNGVIQIQRNAPIGTVYHEAFHYVLDMVLSPEERQQIIDLAKNEYGNNLTDYEAEERLANDFRRYSIDENDNSISGKLKRWFRKIWDKITRYNRISDPTVNQLFWKINNGEMISRAAEAESFDANQQKVLREIRNVQQEKYTWSNLDADVRNNLEEYSGITQEKYDKMSLEEKEQYVKCRG